MQDEKLVATLDRMAETLGDILTVLGGIEDALRGLPERQETAESGGGVS